MNGALVHLLLNHVPIMGSLFTLCLLIYGMAEKSGSVIRAAHVALIATALVSIPAFISGEDAEEVVERITSVNKSAIETHEDMAEIAFWALMMNAAIALGTMIASKKSENLSKPLVWVNLIFLFIVFVLMARTGWSGGEIRHSEIHIEKQAFPSDADD